MLVLFDFLNNRCDDAALRVTIDGVLDGSRAIWTDMTQFERTVALSVLEKINEDVHTLGERLKNFLGSP